MLFANPFMLWGLLAVSIPVIIHLFNLQRYKKVYFTNVRFLQQLQQQSRRQSVLRHWLALLFRILAIAALVLAFAKPFIPSPLGAVVESEGVASIYIDNSFSMETEGRNGTLIDEAVTRAEAIPAGHSRSDKFNLLTNDFSGMHHRMVSIDEYGTMLGDVGISPAVRNLSDVLNRQYDILNKEKTANRAVYLISDFQRNAVSFAGFTPDTSTRHYFIQLQPVRYSNLSIDSVWFETPVQQIGQVIRMHVRVSNYDEKAREKIPVRLVLNGTQRAMASFDVNAGSDATEVLSFTIRETGNHFGFVELSDYPVTFDDRMYFSFRVLPSISVLNIFDQQSGPYLRALFRPDTLFRYMETNLRQLNYAEVHNQQLIVLNGLSSIPSGLSTELNRFVENGGGLFVIPSPQIDRLSYEVFLGSFNTALYTETDTARNRVSELNLLHPIFRDVFESRPGSGQEIGPDTDLPWVFQRYGFRIPARGDVQTLIALRNAEPFMLTSKFGNGSIFIIASPLDAQFTTFPVHAIFVPVMYKAALISSPIQEIYHLVGTQQSVNIGNVSPGVNQVFKLSSSDGQMKFIPGHRVVNYSTHLSSLDAIAKAGNYYLTAGDDTLQVLSFNYDRRESVPDYLSVDELYDIAANTGITNFAVISETGRPAGQVISELSRGKQLWKYFIIGALAFLLAEILVLRFLP